MTHQETMSYRDVGTLNLVKLMYKVNHHTRVLQSEMHHQIGVGMGWRQENIHTVENEK